MKKLLLIFTFFLASLSGVMAQKSAGIEVGTPKISERIAGKPHIIEVSISWGKDAMPEQWQDSAWVFADYELANGNMARIPLNVSAASLTSYAPSLGAPKVEPLPDNNSGIYLIGNAKHTSNTASSFTAKLSLPVTTAFSDDNPFLHLFSMCVYATNYPPRAIYEITSGSNTVNMKGTEPYCGVLATSAGTVSFPSTSSSFTLRAGERVQSFVDATGNEGLIECGTSAIPSAATVTAPAVVIFGKQTTLTATVGTGVTSDWYDAAGNQLSPASSTYTITPTYENIKYYAQARNATLDCESVARAFAEYQVITPGGNCPGMGAGLIGTSATCATTGAGQIGMSSVCASADAGIIGKIVP